MRRKIEEARADVARLAAHSIGADRFRALEIVDVVIHGEMDGNGRGDCIEFRALEGGKELRVFVEIVGSEDPNMHGWLGMAVWRMLDGCQTMARRN